MYCAKCGSLINDALKYCKSCGVKLVKENDANSPGSILDNLLTALCFVSLGGLGILIGLVATLLKNGVDPIGVAIIAGFYLAALFGICFMLLRPVPKLIDAKLKNAEGNEFVQPVQLSAPITAQLEEHREPVRSVTENTTRTFDKIPLKEI